MPSRSTGLVVFFISIIVQLNNKKRTYQKTVKISRKYATGVIIILFLQKVQSKRDFG